MESGVKIKILMCNFIKFTNPNVLGLLKMFEIIGNNALLDVFLVFLWTTIYMYVLIITLFYEYLIYC